MSKINKKRIRNNYSIQSIIPLILVVLLVPLIVRLKMVPVSEGSQIFTNGQEVTGDLFSYYKMVIFLTLSVIGTLVFAYKCFLKENIIIKKTNTYYHMVIFSILAILSTIFATHKDVALYGFWQRYEGLYVLIGYMVILFLAINLMGDEKQVRYLFFFLGASAIVMSFIGISQLLGRDVFETSIGRKIMIPSQYRSVIEDLKFQIKNTIYGTLSNPNYVGLYMSTVFTISSTILLLSKDKYTRIFSATVALLTFINLLGSGSRTGLISIVLFVFLIIIFFRSALLRRWKSAIILILSIFIIMFGINYYKEGYIKNRIISIKDIVKKAEGSNLNDIILKDNEARILIEDYEIKMIYSEGELKFKDKAENSIEFINTDKKISFKKEPYNSHNMVITNFNDTVVLQSNILTNRGMKRINLAIDADDNLHILGVSGELTDVKKYPSWGFDGRENFASSRGYIWSRTFPLLNDTFILGYGPDTYGLHFPNDDYLGKLQSDFRVNVLVDKPHNLYLQTAINTGGISLISLLVIFIMYIISSIKIYINKKNYNDFFEIAGIGIFFAVCSYLMMGFLNDSVVSIAPVFWILLGTGISINLKLNDEGNKTSQK